MLDRRAKPIVREIPFLNTPETETLTLHNGIKVIILDSGEEQVSRITFSWNGGRFDTSNPAIGAMMAQTFKDASSETNHKEMADILDTCGAWITSEIHTHHTSLNLFTINSTIQKVLPRVIEAINHPTFPDDIVDANQAQMAANRMREEKKVGFQTKILEDNVIYGHDHPASRNVSVEEILNITRNDLIELFNTSIAGQPPVVYIAGRIDMYLKQYIIEQLMRIDCYKTNWEKPVITPFKPGAPDIFKKDVDGALQSAIRISIPTVSRQHPDYEKIRIVTTALGGYFGSRLMSVIREEMGLTYGISASLLGYHEGSFITIASQCDNRYTEQVVTETLNEIHRLSSQPMPFEELTTLKRFVSANLASMFDTPFSAMDYYITHRHSNTPDNYLERQQLALNKLSTESVMQIATEYIDKIPKYISIAGKIIS